MATFGGAFTWDEPVAASPPAIATVAATAETAVFCGVQAQSTHSVAAVATVAEWKIGVLSLETGPHAEGIDRREWRRLVADAQSTLTAWGYELAATGWTTLQVFGTNANPRHRSVSKLGLVAFLAGRPVDSVTAASAAIRNRSGANTRVYRDLIMPGGVAIWDLLREVSP